MNQFSKGRRVGLVAPYPPFRGGIAHFSARFHSSLQQVGVQVVGVSFSRQYPQWLFPGTSQYADHAIESFNAPPMVDSINPFSWKKAANYLISEGVDEVAFMIWMPFFAPAYLRMVRILKKRGIKITAIVHNAFPHKKQPFGRVLTQTLLNQCDRIIALSENVRQDIQQLDVPQSHAVEVLPHPVYNQFGDRIDKGEARRQLKLDEKGPLILFFGLVRSYKGLDVLLQALAETDHSIRLLIAGEWYDDQDLLKKLMSDPRIADRIVSHNAYIADDQVKVYFSAADVLVQPYRSATQSGVVQMALHFNVPSIVTSVGGLPEMVQHGVSGLVVPPENPAPLAMAINTFFEGDTATKMAQATEKMKAEWSWEHFVQRFINA